MARDNSTYHWNNISASPVAGTALYRTGLDLLSKALNPVMDQYKQNMAIQKMNMETEKSRNTGKIIDQILQGREVDPKGIYNPEEITKARQDYQEYLLDKKNKESEQAYRESEQAYRKSVLANNSLDTYRQKEAIKLAADLAKAKKLAEMRYSTTGKPFTSSARKSLASTSKSSKSSKGGRLTNFNNIMKSAKDIADYYDLDREDADMVARIANDTAIAGNEPTMLSNFVAQDINYDMFGDNELDSSTNFLGFGRNEDVFRKAYVNYLMEHSPQKPKTTP